MRSLLKWIAIILIILLIVLLCVLGAAYFLMGTERGFKLATEQIGSRVEGLELGEVSGNLKTGINTDSLSFKNEQINVKANGVESQWRSDCLFQKAVCVDKVVIDELDVQTFATDEEKPASTGDIALPDIKLPVSFDVQEVLVKTFRFQPPGDAPAQELKNIKLSARSEGDVLQIDELSTQYNNISVSGKGNITPEGEYPLDLELQIDATDFLEEYDASTNIQLGNSLTDLDVDVQVSGAVNATITGNVKPLEKKLPVNLAIQTDQAGWPLDTNTIAQANDVRLNINGDMDDYNFELQGKVRGEQIPDSTLSLKGLANTSRALLSDITINTLDGFVTGNAAVSWQDRVTWVSRIIAKDINPAIKYEGVDGKLNANISANGDLVDGKWTLDLEQVQVDGTLRDLPFKLDTKLSKSADERWNLSSLILNNGSNRINAAGTVSDEWDLNADIKLPELKNLLPGLTGGFKANVDLKGELKNPDAKITANTTAIKYNEIAIEGLALNADVKRGALADSVLELRVAKVTAGVQTIANTKLNLAGTRAKHTIDLFADGPQKTSVDLTAAGGLSDTFDWTGILNKVKLEVPAHEINLRDDTELSWNNTSKKFSVDAHCWSIQESNVCLKNKVLAQDSGQALLSLDAYRLEQLNPFLPAESTLGGKLKADIVFDWGEAFAGGYAATLDAGISDGEIKVRDTNGQPLTFMYDTLTLKTKADAKVVDSTLTIDSKSMGQASIDLAIDPASETKDIKGRIDLSGFKINFLKAFLPNYDDISGSISAQGDLSGPLLDPLYNGNVVLSSLVVKSEDLPIAVDGGVITTTIAGKRARINGELQSGQGKLGVTGTANWLDKSWRADIKIDAEALAIVQDPLTSSTVNTKLTISARPESVRVRGRIDIPAAEINIKELPKGAVTVSEDVIVIEDIYAETQKNNKKKAAKTAIDVKVNVSLGDNVNLTGYGLIASLTGNMSVTQRSPNPVQLGGEITIVNGIFKQYGQDLKITDGQILFVGPVDQTSLNIDAVREVENGTRVAGLHIDGRVENPEISLFTEPADASITQETILSYIVLGRPLSGATGGQQELMAAALLALTLRGGKAYTDDIANKLGLQELTVDARGGGNSDTEVVVSGRVNDRLLLRYGRSVFNDSYTLYLRYDLTRQLYLEAARGATKAVDIFYTFSF